MSITREAIAQPFWSLGIPEALHVLSTSEQGLEDAEVRSREKQFDLNHIEAEVRLARTKVFVNQFKSPLILILLGAGIITLILRDYVDAIVIFAAVVANTLLGYWQENKAEDALQALKSYLTTRAKVRRGGLEREIDALELVPGDIIKISQGDHIAADARLIFVNDLEIDEAVLTGESSPVEKRVETLPAGTLVAERTNMVMGGTLAIGGFAEAVVTVTGKQTEFGKIAALVASREREPTPLQRAINRFSAVVGIILLALTVILFTFGLTLGYQPLEMFLIAVAVAVSAVPEGLPVALTVVLAVGVTRLVHRKGVVRRLLAAETLGSATLILTDKTGTLTEARMELASIISQVADERTVLERAIANADIVLENPSEAPADWKISGRPIEVALVRAGGTRGIARVPADRLLDRFPFSSVHKFSATMYREGNKIQLGVFGAPEILLGYTNLSSQDKEKIETEIASRARAGGRVLGVLGKSFENEPPPIKDALEARDLTFMGLLVFQDPLRSTVADAIRRIGQAGVRTVMVTGDHQGTAEAVGRELGFIDGTGAVLTGQDLAQMSPQELAARAPAVTIYARTTPEQKLQLVKLYQSLGEVVAVTGDGVNDAPALKAADIGVAVGSGTEVAKRAADLVILDDNFETIVAAIEEGRRVLGNIRKAIVYLMSNVADELFLIGGALALGLALPLTALQILFVNFFSDSFPAIAFAFEKGIDGLGIRPRVGAKSLFDREMKFLILVIGFLTSFLLFVLYAVLLRAEYDPAVVRTFVFTCFATYTLLLAFALRSLDKSLIHYNPFANPYLTGGVAIGLALTLFVVYVPTLGSIFGTVPLPPIWLLGVLAVGLANIILVEFAKWFARLKII